MPSTFIPPTFVSRKISPVGIGKFSMNVMVLVNQSDVNRDDESKIDSTRSNPAIYIVRSCLLKVPKLGYLWLLADSN